MRIHESEETAHGQDAHATSSRGTGVRGNQLHATLEIRQGAHLPHWTLSHSGVYAVTFRLADSLPKPVFERLLRVREVQEKEIMVRQGKLSKDEGLRLKHLHSEQIEAHLDAGGGSCWLKQPAIAELVVHAFRFFAGNRYHLHAWCVMPNHVHILVEPLPGFTLTKIVHSWKSFTANAANTLLARTGDFWQAEYYDHLIRDESDYAHAICYMEQNPLKAGLKDWR